VVPTPPISPMKSGGYSSFSSPTPSPEAGHEPTPRRPRVRLRSQLLALPDKRAQPWGPSPPYSQSAGKRNSANFVSEKFCELRLLRRPFGGRANRRERRIAP
jgi:hypothetical protein